MVCGIAGKSRVVAGDEQRAALSALAGSRDRGEADRGRAVLLTLAGWTSCLVSGFDGAILSSDSKDALMGEVLHGCATTREAVRRAIQHSQESLKASIAPGPRSRRARACASAVRNCPRPCEKKFRWRRPRHTLKGRQTESEMERVGLRPQLRKQQAEAGDIVLLYGDESEALTHPYLARAWAKSGRTWACRRPGKPRGRDAGVARSPHPPTYRS
jgi:hypothetical protein